MRAGAHAASVFKMVGSEGNVGNTGLPAGYALCAGRKWSEMNSASPGAIEGQGEASQVKCTPEGPPIFTTPKAGPCFSPNFYVRRFRWGAYTQKQYQADFKYRKMHMNPVQQHLAQLVAGESSGNAAVMDDDLRAEINATMGDPHRQQALGLYALLLINSDLLATAGTRLMIAQAQGQTGAEP